MPTLFIDTHSEKVTIAVLLDGHVFKKEKTSDRGHSEIAVPLLDEVLREANLKCADIKEIVVVNGPGSFTGVRIGVTIAKALCYCLSIPIKTITSLEMFGVSSSSKFDLVTVEDSKGVYSARVTDDAIYSDFLYQKKTEFENYKNENGYVVLEDKTIVFDKIMDYLSTKEYSNPHLVNPIYIKEIDALK